MSTESTGVRIPDSFVKFLPSLVGKDVRIPDSFVKFLPSLVGKWDSTSTENQPHSMFYTPELRTAFAKGDYASIKASEKKVADDLTPNFNSIKDNKKDAFVTVTNPSDGVDYQICASEHGWIWSYVYQDTQTIDGKTVENLWAQVGTYSANGQVLGLSNTKWQAEWGNLAAQAISLVISSSLVTFIASRLAGMTFAEAASAAMAEILAEGIATEAFAAVFSTVVGGIIVGVILTVLVYIAIHVIWKKYTLQVDIHSWIPDDYIIVDWYSDNAAVGEGKKWEAKKLPGLSDTVQMPDGTKIPSKDSISRYDRYVYENVNTVFEGLGIAMKVIKADDPGKGFMIKYGLWRFSDNQFGIQTNVDATLENFYKRDSAWFPRGTYTNSQPFDNTTITVTTDFLSGATDELYRCNVHIGV